MGNCNTARNTKWGVWFYEDIKNLQTQSNANKNTNGVDSRWSKR